MFSVDNTKMKRGWDIPFFNYIKIKWSMQVPYSFKTTLDYSSLYRSMYFWYHHNSLKNILSIEKLTLYSNKQTNFNKLGFLSRVFQIVLRDRGDGKFAWRDFFIGWWESDKEWFWPIEPFSKLKTIFFKYWTLIKIKVSMTCLYKEDKVKIAQELWLQLKMKSSLGYT